jgi:hypothetical protein
MTPAVNIGMSVSRSGFFTLGNGPSVPAAKGWWMDLKPDFDTTVQRKISVPAWNQTIPNIRH